MSSHSIISLPLNLGETREKAHFNKENMRNKQNSGLNFQENLSRRFQVSFQFIPVGGARIT